MRPSARADRTVVLSRVVAFALGPITILAVGTYVDPSTQGFYYSFTSVLAASTLFEAGIATALVQIAAHEAAHVKLTFRGIGSQTSDASGRLAAVCQFAVRWYSSIAVIMAVAIGGAGIVLFSARPTSIDWFIPWTLFIIAAAIDFALQPFFVLLEGTGHVVYVYRYRMARSVVQNLVLIASVASGLALFALALGTIAAVIVGSLFLWPARRLFVGLLRRRAKGAIRWRTEILPFQAKIAVSWICGYFSTSIFTPLLLATRGPVLAGQMGMSLLLTGACTGLAASFMVSRAPLLGNLASSSDWRGLSALFRERARTSILVAATLLLIGLIGLVVLDVLHIPIAARVLPWWQLTILAFGALAYHVEGVLAFFMRAQKREPYFILELCGMALILPLSLTTAPLWGALGPITAFAAVHVVLMLPAAWMILARNQRQLLSRSVHS